MIHAAGVAGVLKLAAPANSLSQVTALQIKLAFLKFGVKAHTASLQLIQLQPEAAFSLSCLRNEPKQEMTDVIIVILLERIKSVVERLGPHSAETEARSLFKSI